MGIARFVRRHERKLIVAWLLACVLVVGVVGVWGVALGGAERVVDRWNWRWGARVERGRQLVDEGRYEEAAVFLERLDADFPAVSIKHRMDRQREELLELLGSSYTELDRKGRALKTFERLAEFDERNWRNHYLLGAARQRFSEPEEADEAFARVLAIHPSHLPSVEARITQRFEGGLYAEVPPLYEAYLDGWLLGRMTLRIGAREVPIQVSVDGREQVVEGPIDVPADWGGEVCLLTAGYSVRIGTIELREPLRVGVAEAARTTVVRDAEGWTATDAEPAGRATWSARSPAAAICRGGVPDDHALTRVRLELTVYKAVPAGLWEMVEKSYANTLDHEGLEAARARSVIGGCLEAGSIFLVQ
jgi:hypothetical protein